MGHLTKGSTQMFEKLMNSIKEHPEFTVFFSSLVGLAAGALLMYSTRTFATKDEQTEALTAIVVQLEDMKQEIENNGDAILKQGEQFRISTLQAERRELTRQIREIENASDAGLASDREMANLPGLQSDLDDINDELRRIGK